MEEIGENWSRDPRPDALGRGHSRDAIGHFLLVLSPLAEIFRDY